MMNEASLLGIRLRMERLISEREAMKALNEWRASRGEAQAYNEGAFDNNAKAFMELGQCLSQEVL